ncbi:MAG: hypothetical protein AVDCRST_MAG68-227, partial [uncultured Gemmatimonadetes bacterium]
CPGGARIAGRRTRKRRWISRPPPASARRTSAPAGRAIH